MTTMGSAGTLGELLGSGRRRRFVGRASEIELFRVALDSAEPPFSVLHIYGPAGVGKTSLLDVLAGLAAEAGASVVRLDGRDLVPSPPAVLGAVRRVLRVPEGEGVVTGPSGADRVVVLVDTYEQLAPLDDWVRTRLLPRLPATALTVIAGRNPPSSAWRSDPAWRELLRVVSLRNLSPQESRQYLHACGIDPARHDQLVEVTHGRPLGLSLLADVIARGGGTVADPLTPDLVGILLRRFVEVVPSGLHRRALEVCALARVTTEALLREVLTLEDAHELFAWLRGLSFVESGPDGLFPHDLARDALESDLRWRDPEGYQRCSVASAATSAAVCGRAGGTSSSARSSTRSSCFAAFPASCRRWIGTTGAGPIRSRRGRRIGSRSLTWSWRGRVRRRRQSPSGGGSCNPRASSSSGARTARLAAFSRLWT
jgi:energy-coupling factor transporter ATP-binding protein EcfA2